MELIYLLLNYVLVGYFIFSILYLIREVFLLYRYIRNPEKETPRYERPIKYIMWLGINTAYIITFLILGVI